MPDDLGSLSSRLDAQDNLLRALAITQSDHTGRLTRLEAAVGRVEAGIREILTLLQDGGQRPDPPPR